MRCCLQFSFRDHIFNLKISPQRSPATAIRVSTEKNTVLWSARVPRSIPSASPPPPLFQIRSFPSLMHESNRRAQSKQARVHRTNCIEIVDARASFEIWYLLYLIFHGARAPSPWKLSAIWHSRFYDTSGQLSPSPNLADFIGKHLMHVTSPVSCVLRLMRRKPHPTYP